MTFFNKKEKRLINKLDEFYNFDLKQPKAQINTEDSGLGGFNFAQKKNQKEFSVPFKKPDQQLKEKQM